MLVTKRIVVNARISSKSIDDVTVTKEIESKYVGYNYGNLGLVNSLTVVQKGFCMLSSKKSIFAVLPVIVDLRIFTIPEGFIIANAELNTIKNNLDNNSFYLFSCSPKDEFGNQIISKHKDKDGKDLDNFVAVLSTMNKTPEMVKNYRHLAIGSRCNVMCKNVMINDGKLHIAFNCDIVEHIELRYFIHDASIDTKRINDLAIKAKASGPIFSLHASYFGKTVEKLEVGKPYCMSIYGLSPESDPKDEAIDFIKLNTTEAVMHSNSSMDLNIGMDTINNYLYYTMLNWRSVYETSI
jgi:hypothetical protein